MRREREVAGEAAIILKSAGKIMARKLGKDPSRVLRGWNAKIVYKLTVFIYNLVK